MLPPGTVPFHPQELGTMAGVEHIPAALFFTAKDCSLDVDQSVSSRNHSRHYVKDRQSKIAETQPGRVWDLWLATDSNDDAPKVHTDNQLNDNTATPVQSSPLRSPARRSRSALSG